MAANDELPRGWVQSISNTGPSITYPAVPGITWVLTHADVVGYGAPPGPTGIRWDIEIPNGTITEQYFLEIIFTGVNTYSGVNDSWDGELMGQPGQSLGIAADVLVAGAQVTLRTSAYPT